MTEAQRDYVALLERCYAETDNQTEWVAGLLEGAKTGIDQGLGLAFNLIAERGAEREVVHYQGAGLLSGPALTRLARTVEGLDQVSYRAMYYAKRVTLSSSQAGELSETGYESYLATRRNLTASDFLGLLGHPSPGHVCALIVPLPRPLRVTGRLRDALNRMLIHIETGLRLRFSQSEGTAVLSPDGRVLHATGSAKSREHRDRLQAQSRVIERSRTTAQRARPDEALAAWNALVEGRWCLVERTERDGRRYYVAHENPPYAARHRRLSATECGVLDLSLSGLAGKHVSYALGLSQSRISECLGAAAQKLGLRTRADLIRLGSGLLRGPGAVLQPAGLSPSERIVLAHLREGRSNEEIAQLRGTAVRTVANQVAAILRKTGAVGRRALLT